MPCTVTDTVKLDESMHTDSKHAVQAGCSPDREVGRGGCDFPLQLVHFPKQQLALEERTHVCVLSVPMCLNILANKASYPHTNQGY